MIDFKGGSVRLSRQNTSRTIMQNSQGTFSCFAPEIIACSFSAHRPRRSAITKAKFYELISGIYMPGYKLSWYTSVQCGK